MRAFSVTRNLTNLTKDSKDKEFAVANGFKTIGVVTVIIGHRIAMDLGMPSFIPDFPKKVQKMHGFFLSGIKLDKEFIVFVNFFQ